jgi:hypothetical protein
MKAVAMALVALLLAGCAGNPKAEYKKPWSPRKPNTGCLSLWNLTRRYSVSISGFLRGRPSRLQNHLAEATD